MAEWEPITRGKPDIEGIHPEAKGLLRVTIPLQPAPTGEWAEFFANPIGVGMSLAMHAPELHGGTVFIQPPDSELDQYVAHVDERIRSANARYERDVLPRLERERHVAEADSAETTRRLDDARRRAQEL